GGRAVPGCPSRTSSGALVLARSWPNPPFASAPVGAVAAAAARSSAAEPLFARQLVADPIEFLFLHPADLARVDLCVAVETAPALLAAFVEVDVGQPVPPALSPAAPGETRPVRTDVDAARHAHDVALSGRRPRVVSSCRMCA